MAPIFQKGKNAVISKDEVDSARKEINLAKKSLDVSYDSHLDTESALYREAQKSYY